jgi:hypothetical protein
MAATIVSKAQLATLKDTMTKYAQSLTGGYQGSRMEKARYMYEKTIHANFIELSAKHQLEPEEFRTLLSNVHGVRDVALHPTSKEEQNNPGAQDPKNRVRRQGHYQAQNLMVFSKLYPRDVYGMEFELTESKHCKNPNLPLTISACYKEQGDNERALEAWRILRAAVSGKELDVRIVVRFEEELKKAFNASVEDREFTRGTRNTHSTTSFSSFQGQTWIKVSQNLAQNSNRIVPKAAIQKPGLRAMIARNAAMNGITVENHSMSNIEPGSASSSSQQQSLPIAPEPGSVRSSTLPNHVDTVPASSSSELEALPNNVDTVPAPVTKKMVASSLPQELDRYRQEEKVRIQVKAALLMLSGSTRTIIRMEEILARPGACVLEPIFRFALEQQEEERLTAVEMIAVLDEFISAAEKSGDVATPATASVSDDPTSSAAHQQPALQSLLQKSLEPVSDSSADAVLHIQNKVLTDMATHFNLKFTNKPLWMTLRHKGMVEFPTELALKTSRLLFKSDHEILSKKEFLNNPAAYEPNPGFVYCDAKNDIMAKYFDAHVQELTKKNRWMSELIYTSDEKKSDPIEVVLAVYRDEDTPQARETMNFLERELQKILTDEYESQGPVVSGSANTDEEDDTLQEEVQSVMDTSMSWDRQDAEAEQMRKDAEEEQMRQDAKATEMGESAKADTIQQETDQMQQTESQRSKQQMLDFKAKGPIEEVRWRGRGMAHPDPYIENTLRVMLGSMDGLGTSLWDTIWLPLKSTVTNRTTSVREGVVQAETVCKQFLKEARARSLAFKTWTQCKAKDGIVLQLTDKAMDEFFENREDFFEQLPAAVLEKFESSITDTFISKYDALTGLIDRHSGEVVDLNTGSIAQWKLIPLRHVSLVQALPDQFALGPNYQAPQFSVYDRIVLEQHMMEVSARCKWRTPTAWLRPNFAKQVNRLVLPCQGTQYYCWVRTGHVITLGELFQEMHKRYNAREIYDLYFHLDIVAVKRRKPASKNHQSRQRRDPNS